MNFIVDSYVSYLPYLTMKTLSKSLLGVIFSLITFTASTQAQSTYVATDEDLARGYVINEEDNTVTFVFCQRMWMDSGSYVIVKGSFNGWLNGQNMLLPDEQGNKSITLPLATLMVPGNSGRPEFQMVANGMTLSPERSRVGVPDGYVFADGNKHFMIIMNEADLAQAKIDNAKVAKRKTLADFDLTTREGLEEISNFRKVPGTTNMFRSFHPIKYTYTSYDTEYPRHVALERLCVEEGIASDINLSGASSLSPTAITLCGSPFMETVPEFYKEIMGATRVLNVGVEHGIIPPTSEDVYFQHWFSNGQLDVNKSKLRISQMIQEIVHFVNSDKSKAPYLIHCHVGQDRTGVMCALISGLCGASWEVMAQDFEKTQRLGNKELKGRGLLKFALEKYLGIEPTPVAIPGGGIESQEDIAGAIRKVLTTGGFLTEVELDQFVAKLNPPVVEGDADGDNMLSINDVVLIAKKAVDRSTMGMVKQNMDLDGDGISTTADVTKVIQKILEN